MDKFARSGDAGKRRRRFEVGVLAGGQGGGRVGSPLRLAGQEEAAPSMQTVLHPNHARAGGPHVRGYPFSLLSQRQGLGQSGLSMQLLPYVPVQAKSWLTLSTWGSAVVPSGRSQIGPCTVCPSKTLPIAPTLLGWGKSRCALLCIYHHC